MNPRRNPYNNRAAVSPRRPTLSSLTPNAALVALALAGWRFLPHPPNFAPFGAFALLAGLFIGGRAAVMLPLAALVLSDIFLNIAAGCPPVFAPRAIDWLAFAGIGLAGSALRRSGLAAKLSAGAATPFAFFLLSNFGVWLFGLGLNGLPYAKTAGGLAECYAAGLPFLRATIAGDWLFMALFAPALALASRGVTPARAAA